MGLSIHYSGILKSPTLIPVLVEEIQDVCTIMKWRYQTFEDALMKGICFTPPECETLMLMFYETGELVCPVSLQFGTGWANIVSVKTQFAGIEVHRTIIKLLKHVKAAYFERFELNDEGGYWESGNEEMLQKKFKEYGFLMDAAGAALQDFKGKDGDTPETLVERLEKFLRGSLGRNNL